MESKYTFDENTVSDLHKDAYGFRPNRDWWVEWNLLDDNGKQELWDSLIEALKRTIADTESREQRAMAQTEAYIQNILETVSGSTRADAIRFLDDTYGTNGDINFLEYHLGVPYGYLTGQKPWMLSSKPEQV
jgi:hypothetical protein